MYALIGYGESVLGQAVRGTVQGDPPGGAGTQGAQHPHPRDPYIRYQGTEIEKFRKTDFLTSKFRFAEAVLYPHQVFLLPKI